MKETNRNSGTSYLSDDQIVELYWTREERAISATAQKYGKYLFTIAYNIVHDNLDSEECVNDTYLGTWNSIPPARPNAFQIFISKIARGIAINKFKSKTAKKRIPAEIITALDELDECISCDSSMEHDILVRSLGKVISEYLDSLDDDMATVFICRYYYSDKIDDIAKMQNVHRSTVFRALAKMREDLRERLIKEGLWDYE